MYVILDTPSGAYILQLLTNYNTLHGLPSILSFFLYFVLLFYNTLYTIATYQNQFKLELILSDFKYLPPVYCFFFIQINSKLNFTIARCSIVLYFLFLEFEKENTISTV